MSDFEEVSECLVCCEQVDEFIKCPCCMVVMCCECLIKDLQTSDTYEKMNRVNSSENAIKCVDRDCEGEILLQHICILLSSDNFNKFFFEWNKIIKNKIEYELNQQKNSRIFNEVDEMINYCNNIMTPCCPSCFQGFDDFTGCFAVKCSRCPTNFCAWCLDFFGDSESVHKHVLICQKKLNEENSYYGTIEDFQQSNSFRIKEKINLYLENKSSDIVSKVTNGICHTLELHNLFIDDYNRVEVMYEDEFNNSIDDYENQSFEDGEEQNVYDEFQPFFDHVAFRERINYLLEQPQPEPEPEPEPEPQPEPERHVRRKRVIKCGKCGLFNHNRRTCIF